MNEQLASCIRRIGEDLIALSDAILLPDSTEPTAQPTTPAEPTDGKEEEKPTKKSRKKKPQEPDSAAADPITHEQLRELLGSIAASGHSGEVAALLREYGEGKLSTVPEENYQALYKAAKEITQETEDQDTKGIGDDNA